MLPRHPVSSFLAILNSVVVLKQTKRKMCTLLFPLDDRESKPIPEFFWLLLPVPDWTEARLLLVLSSDLLYLCIIGKKSSFETKQGKFFLVKALKNVTELF